MNKGFYETLEYCEKTVLENVDSSLEDLNEFTGFNFNSGKWISQSPNKRENERWKSYGRCKKEDIVKYKNELICSVEKGLLSAIIGAVVKQVNETSNVEFIKEEDPNKLVEVFDSNRGISSLVLGNWCLPFELGLYKGNKTLTKDLGDYCIIKDLGGYLIDDSVGWDDEDYDTLIVLPPDSISVEDIKIKMRYSNDTNVLDCYYNFNIILYPGTFTDYFCDEVKEKIKIIKVNCITI